MPAPRKLRYLEIKDHIIEAIGRLSPGAPITPEREIAEACQASRTTVRKAVTELVAEGRLVRRQGSGTFVAEAKLAWPLTASGFTRLHAAGGLRVSTRLLSIDRHRAGPELAERLGISVGGQVLSMEFLRNVNGTPLAVECAYVPARRYPGLTKAVVRTGSIHEALRTAFGISVTHAVGTIETAPAKPHEAALLRTDTGAPMLLVSQHSHTAEGDVVEWARTCYRGDRASFVAHLTQATELTAALTGAAAPTVL